MIIIFTSYYIVKLFVIADLAYMIAKKYPGLVAAKDGKGKTALQLLSSNPSAFKSGRSYGLLKSFINYCNAIFPSL